MYFSEVFSSSWWWVWPVLMIAMCFLMMRRFRWPMMCGFGYRHKQRSFLEASDSASQILDKRYAAGEIDQAEYEEKKRALSGS